jgi:hypothetical protein
VSFFNIKLYKSQTLQRPNTSSNLWRRSPKNLSSSCLLTKEIHEILKILQRWKPYSQYTYLLRVSLACMQRNLIFFHVERNQYLWEGVHLISNATRFLIVREVLIIHFIFLHVTVQLIQIRGIAYIIVIIPTRAIYRTQCAADVWNVN